MFLDPVSALLGRVDYFAFCVCVYVCPFAKYVKKYWTNQVF